MDTLTSDATSVYPCNDAVDRVSDLFASWFTYNTELLFQPRSYFRN
jgi:hypothetical protein